jgi:hypothetical protein
LGGAVGGVYTGGAGVLVLGSGSFNFLACTWHIPTLSKTNVVTIVFFMIKRFYFNAYSFKKILGILSVLIML